jgi:hypothetical protein
MLLCETKTVGPAASRAGAKLSSARRRALRKRRGIERCCPRNRWVVNTSAGEFFKRQRDHGRRGGVGVLRQ